MTRIKFCGMTRYQDLEAANLLEPEYIGFVFAKESKRYVSPQKAAELKQLLAPNIMAVGVTVNEPPDMVAKRLNIGLINIAQLHGDEDESYIAALRKLTDKPIIKAFRITGREDISKAENSTADFVLLDSGAGTGTIFNWDLIQNMKRPYFLAGGLDCENVIQSVKALHPFAVDVSSGIETANGKDKNKMAAFAAAVRKEEKR